MIAANLADPRSPRERVLVLATYAFLAAVALAVLAPNMPIGRVPEHDEGVFLYVAQVISRGDMPYRDVWDHKPPAIYVLNVVALLLGGQWGVWLMQLAALVAAVWLSYRVLAPLGQLAASFGTFAWLTAVLELLPLPAVQTTFIEFYALPLQFAALFVFMEIRTLSTRRALAIGVLGGAAALLKPSLLGIWIAMTLAIAWTGARNGRPREALSQLLTIVAAGAAVIGVAIVWLASADALADAIDMVIGYNLAYSALSSPLDRLAGIAGGILRMLPSGLPILAAFGWLFALRGPRSPVVLVALVALPVELVLASTGRALHYYLLSALPVFGVLAAYLVATIATRSARIARLGVVGLSLAIALLQSAVLSFFLTVEKPSPVPAAVGYLRATTTSDDRVLVWGTRTEVLVLAERRAPTRFVYQVAPLATRGYGSSARIDQLLAELEHSPPAMIIDASRDSFHTPPLDRRGLAALPDDPAHPWPPETIRVIDYLDANYVRAGTIAGIDWPVWRRRSP